MYQKSRSLGRFIVPLLALLFGTSLLVGTVTLAGAGSQSEVASASKLQGGDGCWRVVEDASGNTMGGTLHAVAAITENDVWAVGVDSLIQHWDGVEWTTFPGPTASSLDGIAAISSDDVWAVGYQQGGGERLTLTMHWDGTEWTIIANPNPGPNARAELNGVATISSDDVWAVGRYYAGNFAKTLALHWDGTEWTIVPSPDPGNDGNHLTAIAASAPDNVWAVGRYNVQEDTRNRGLIMHWDGSSWNVVPNFPSDVTSFHSVDVLAPNDVWIGGYSSDVSGETASIQVLKWDGTQLNRIPAPRLYGVLHGVSAVSPTSIWASGWYYNASASRYEMLSLHCDGVECTAVPGIHPEGARHAQLRSVSATSDENVWAVGNQEFSTTDYRPLIVRYNPDDSCPEGLPPSVTPVTATPTSIPSTATATPTVCALQFDDVPSTHTFSPYVRCLACKGIIGGYSDNSFRPNNLLTRDQIAKMVSNSAGFNEPPGTQIFEDIPPTHPFYDYIQRLANRGIMTGYPCGGTGEPCVQPYNRPYFRVGTFTTRGQISKIVAQAKGYTDPVSGQRFEDVPPSNTFYLYIERLASRGIMGGYPCGTVPNEPCGTTNRPYFRWGNNATRGQTTKITSNTFFPGCGTSAGR